MYDEVGLASSIYTLSELSYNHDIEDLEIIDSKQKNTQVTYAN